MPGAPSIDPAKAAEVYNLHAAGYSGNDIARRTGVTRPSVQDILAKHGHWGVIADKPVFIKLRLEQNKALEAAFRAGSAELLGRAFDEDKLKKASTYQLVIASSIALDKSRLLAGESTENIAVHHESEAIEAAADKIAGALMRFQTIVLEPENMDSEKEGVNELTAGKD